MFDYLYQWIRNLAFYLILVTAVIQVIPGSDYKKYIHFFTGLVLIVMLMTPILKLFGMGERLEDYYDYEEYKQQIKEMEDSTRYLEEVDSAQYLEDSDDSGMKDDGGKIDVEEIEIGQ